MIEYILATDFLSFLFFFFISKIAIKLLSFTQNQVLCDDFDFDIVNFPFLDGDVPCRASFGVYISQLIRFARVCSHVADFNARNKCLTAKLLQQGYRYHKLRKHFLNFIPDTMN